MTNEPKEIGTLAEIGAQTGDVVECVESCSSDTTVGSTYKLQVCPDDGYPISFLDDVGDWCEDRDGYEFRIISRAKPTGPVRTVTRTTREIVPGVYGLVTIDDGTVRMDYFIPVEDDLQTLTDAIQTLTAIRDALKEKGE